MTSPNRRELRVQQVTPRLPLAIWGNIFVIIDDGQVSLSEIESIGQRVLELGRQNPSGVGGITVIPATNARPPSEAHRQAIKAAYSVVSTHLKAMCWTVEGQGFRAATIRAALAGLRLLLQAPFPTKVAANLDEALPWLGTQLNGRSPDRLAQGLVEIRSTLSDLQLSRNSLRPLS